MYDVPVHNSVTGVIKEMISHGLHAGEMSQAATILSCSPGLTAFFPFHFLHGVLRDIAGDVWVNLTDHAANPTVKQPGMRRNPSTLLVRNFRSVFSQDYHCVPATSCAVPLASRSLELWLSLPVYWG